MQANAEYVRLADYHIDALGESFRPRRFWHTCASTHAPSRALLFDLLSRHKTCQGHDDQTFAEHLVWHRTKLQFADPSLCITPTALNYNSLTHPCASITPTTLKLSASLLMLRISTLSLRSLVLLTVCFVLRLADAHAQTCHVQRARAQGGRTTTTTPTLPSSSRPQSGCRCRQCGPGGATAPSTPLSPTGSTPLASPFWDHQDTR